MVSQQPQAVTACRRYTDVTQRSSFYYPVALGLPGYAAQALDTTDYRALQRYASNSGTAIGATYSEAVLHGVNECIERDAVSLFLLDQCYHQTHSPLRRVARPSGQNALARLWSDAETEIGAEIVLLDISSEFLPRTFLAFSSARCTAPSVFGSGSSLDARHAAWRALTELVQLQHIAGESEHLNDQRNAQRHLARFPRLLRCLNIDFRHLLEVCDQHTVPLPGQMPEAPLTEQIERIAKDLHRHGRTLGVTRLHQTALGSTLVQVVIPGLERFFVVASGNVVIPQARGRRVQQPAEACA